MSSLLQIIRGLHAGELKQNLKILMRDEALRSEYMFDCSGLSIVRSG